LKQDNRPEPCFNILNVHKKVVEMSAPHPGVASLAEEPTFRDLFTPKLVTILREGYGAAALRADVLAGLTVAIVALPLSMAIAIASGATPERGLYAAIFGGFFVSALGGSRFQIGGPAGAFIVLVASAVERHGIDGVVLAILMAGGFLLIAGFLRIGTYIKFVPYPVTVGFTAGIAVIIFASQIKDLFGLTLTDKEPGEFVAKLNALAGAFGTFNPMAIGIAALSIVLIAGLKRLRPHWPGMLIAVALAALATWAFHLPVETIGTRFGGLPSGLPLPQLPSISFAKAQAVLPDAIAFALLGAIESLLSAVVADGMTGRRHRSNCELVAQGVANMTSALFGGICVTGTIARTATNVRAGARGPVSGMLHAVFLLAFVLLAAPLASFIPLAALAGILVTVAWNMAEKHEFLTLLRSSRGDAVVLLATFLLTIFRDLTEGIIVGFALGAVLFIHRMASAAGIEEHAPLVPADRPDDANGGRTPYDPSLATDAAVVVYRLSGAFFFGTASTVGAVLDRIADQRKAFVIDFSAVPFVDSTAANVIAGTVRKAQRHGVRLFITGASAAVQRTLRTSGSAEPEALYRSTIEDAVREVHAA
jgi:SulP family sulfate permease